MKFIHFLFIFVALSACSGGDSKSPQSGNGQSITIRASGLNSTVILQESISQLNHEIDSDGVYDISLPTGQGIYSLEIVNSNLQSCTLSDELDLVCADIACIDVYNPVCAKKPFSELQCITTPCPTDQYLTYGNYCGAGLNNAPIAIASECQGLQEVVTFHQKPAYITNLALLDIFSNDFDIIDSDIIDDIITIEFEISGGCGSHDFSFFADEVFLESDPVQLSTAISHVANDACDSLIRIEKEFDLLPIKEIYRRNYPTSTGENSIILNNLGTYTFTLN